MKKSDDFSAQELRRLAQSPAGQQLMALLQAEHSGAMDAVQKNAGDLSQARAALSDLLSDPRAQALLKQLQEGYHG